MISPRRETVLKWLVVLLAISSHPVETSRSNQGTEFIVGFMWNTLVLEVGLEIFVTTMSNTPAVVTVTTPKYDSNFVATATVAKQSVQLIIIPHQNRVENSGNSNRGVRIKSTEPITAYCVNKEQFTTDAYVALPINVVGEEYYSIHYLRSPQILIVGVSDSTSGTIKFSNNGRSGSRLPVAAVSVSVNGRTYGNGGTVSWSVNKYNTFFVTQYDVNEADFTGSYITGNKPFTCISGNYRSTVPRDGWRQSSDHLTEMLPSVDTWGKEFVTTSTPDREIGDIFRVVASEAGTNVNFGDGRHRFTLSQPGDFKELDIATGDYMTVVSDKPILVALFAKTWQDDGLHFGDPAMSLLIPTVQFAAEYTWSTTNLPSGMPFNDKISIIIDKNKKNGLTLDGQRITSQWQSVTGSNTWQQTWLFVNPGSHNLFHSDPTVTFMALASGTEQWNSYAFAAGQRMAQVNTPCFPTSPVAGDTVDNDCDGKVDEEALDNIDNDGDGRIDEDLAMPPRVDGNWGQWSQWSCSVTCGARGTKTRSRQCDNPAPQNNGNDCAGSGSASGSCDMRSTPCAVNGGWTNWSGWGSCSVTCDSGTKTKTRSCTNPAPAHGGTDCTGVTSQTTTCDTGQPCIVHGNWGNWAAWGSCSVTCATGSQSRSRSCDNPAPVNGGNQCAGDSSETQSCTKVPCPIDGGWGTWAAWGACSVTCATGNRQRSRQCDRPAPQHLGAQCQGSGSETESCTMVPCPIDGEWTAWSTWSICSLTCGGAGVNERTRTCDNPPPQYLGADCVGDDADYITCDNSHLKCPSGNVWEILTFTTAAGIPVDGGFSQWGEWSDCSATCGGGLRHKVRFCNNPKPQWGGTECGGDFYRTQMCNQQSCPNGYLFGKAQGGTCDDKPGLFECQNGVQCISIYSKCDCNPDCADGSDESVDYAHCVVGLEDCVSGAETIQRISISFALLISVLSLLWNICH